MSNIVIGAKLPPFSWLPNYLVNDKGLSAEGMAAALYLNGKPSGWQARPFDIKARFGWGDRIWYRVSAELKQFGILHEKPTATGLALWFEIPELAPNNPPLQNVNLAKCQPDKMSTLSNKDPINKKDVLNNKDNIAFLKTKNELESRPDLIAKAEIQSLFDKLWETYPLKKGKQQAFKWLMQALQGKRKEVAEKFAIEICGGLKACVEEHNAKQELKSQGADIWTPNLPYLSTWLNNGRWRDDYQKPEEILKGATRKPGIIDINKVFGV